MDNENIDEELKNPSDQRLFAIANAFHRGYSVDKIWELTQIDKWFLNKLKNIITTELALRKFNASNVPDYLVRAGKQLGFSDRQIANQIGSNELAVRTLRNDLGIMPYVKQIDTGKFALPFLFFIILFFNHYVDNSSTSIRLLIALALSQSPLNSPLSPTTCT